MEGFFILIMEELKLISEITVSYFPPVKPSHRSVINSSQDAFTALSAFFNEDTLQLQEQFVILYLNRTNRVIGGYRLSQGGITGTVADIRLILSVALKAVATGVILGHNHPSGNLQPSRQDIELTGKIKQAAELMDIKVLDHLIISSEGNFLSIADEGLL